MENSSSMDFKDMKKHYKHVRNEYKTKISFHRYKEIRAALIPTIKEIEQICEMMGENSCR